MDRLCKTSLSAYSYSTIYLAQILFYWSITYGKSIRIDMRTDPSVYPCLDTFDILMTTPNITDDKYIRLIRVYTSNHMQRYYANTLKLDYVREYKLPMNNYLKIDCHFFEANFRYYCFLFVALSRTTGAVLINGRPHCRPTTMQLIVTSTAGAYVEDNTINSLADEQSAQRLRPAGSSYQYNYPTKEIANNVFGNSRRVSTSSNKINDNQLDDNYLDNQLNDEEIADYISINCKCSDTFDVESNTSTLVINLDIILCNNNNKINRNNNKLYESDDSIDSEDYSYNDYTDVIDMKKNIKTKKKSYLSANRKSTDRRREGRDVSEQSSNYSESVSTICVLNLLESNYKMKVQYENWRNTPVIYVQSTHIPELVVREGRLAIDPQLDINNKSQIHSLSSKYLRIESFYSQNLTLKLILLKSNNYHKKESFTSFAIFLSTLTPIHYTSMLLILLFLICLTALILISLTGTQRKTVVKIVTPSEEGDQTRTSYVEQTDIMSQLSLADDNQSLEMDYYDYLLPFVPRPHSRTTDSAH